MSNISEVNVFSSRVVFFTLFIIAFIAWNLQRQLEESAEFEASKAESKAKGEDTFSGSLPAFIAAFAEGGELSDQELLEIRRMIDSYEGGGKQ